MSFGIRAAIVLGCAAVACNGETGGSRKATSAPSATNAPSTMSVRSSDDEHLLAAISACRSAALLPEAALTHHDAAMRRAATRKLARFADPRAVPALEKRLADEDDEVVAWAAHGLGLVVSGREAETVLALVARVASLPRRTVPPSRFGVGALDAITDSLARAATTPAERTLRALLDDQDRAESAARALTRIAAARHSLDDGTIVALLDAAARRPENQSALAPFAYLGALGPPAAARLLDVGKSALARGGAARSFALRALSNAGPEAIPLLEGALADDKLSSSDRAAAATGLGRFGTDADGALAKGLAALVREAGAMDERSLATTFPPLVATIGALSPPGRAAVDTLVSLSSQPIPADASAPRKRRLVALRCAASAVLAGTASQSSRLVQCDPTKDGRAGALATLRVLARGPLTGARFDGWKAFTSAKDPAVRRAAFALIATHSEMPSVTPILADALHAKEAGIVVEAARALASAPRQATGAPPLEVPAPSDQKIQADAAPSIVDALGKALDAARPPDQLEPEVALARAVGALGILSLKPRVEKLCRSEHFAVRRGAERALASLGGNAVCSAPPEKATSGTLATPSEPHALSLTFVTDGGRLGMTLDPTLAPLAVDRIAGLARAGFYDGQIVQRALPGAVVQFGDPVGDGYTGSGKPVLPSETSPAPSGALAVGLAEAGRDTGSSQIFVTLADDPTLDGDYPLIGFADPEWASAAEGDVIRNVEM